MSNSFAVPSCGHKNDCAGCWGEYASMAHEIERLQETLEWVIGYGCPEKVEKRIREVLEARDGER